MKTQRDVKMLDVSDLGTRFQVLFFVCDASSLSIPFCHKAALGPLVACLKGFGPSIATWAWERKAAAKLLLHQNLGGLRTREDRRTTGVGLGDKLFSFSVFEIGSSPSSSLLRVVLNREEICCFAQSYDKNCSHWPVTRYDILACRNPHAKIDHFFVQEKKW